ncbi:hypothetical protein, partial [Salmonella enterica]|uniref:hypothetical protein n=1 Tax=Salmonella enterica TaxID=28901 RepID=UPI001F1E985F
TTRSGLVSWDRRCVSEKDQLPALKAKVANAVTEERAKGFTMIKSVLDRIREAQ